MPEPVVAERTAVRSERRGDVLVLTLARPDKGNALRQQDIEAVIAEIESVRADPSARSIVLRAEGKHFCAGADLQTANKVDRKPTIGHVARALETGPHRMIDALWNCPVPIVSAVQGRAMGLGLHLAVVCDFVIAAPDARFSEPFSRRGFSADSGGTFLLPKLIGIRRARQMLLRGIDVDAATARDWGLIDDVIEDGALDDAAFALAAELASGPTFSLGHTKQLLNRRAPVDMSSALLGEADSVEATIRSVDFKEGIRAFAERRDPVFVGY